MALNTEVNDPNFDRADAIAYEFFMDNLPNILGDSFNNPEVTDEEINQIVDAIRLLALMSYKIAQTFEHVRGLVKEDQKEN